MNLLSENENGATYTLDDRPTSSFLFANRKKGAMFGNHWHKGESKTKNPEVLLLISGHLTMWVCDVDGSKKEEVDLRAPLKLKIYPHVLHSFQAETDCVFLEFNSLEEHVADTYYPTQEG